MGKQSSRRYNAASHVWDILVVLENNKLSKICKFCKQFNMKLVCYTVICNMNFLFRFKGSSLGFDNRGRITSSYAHNSEFIYSLSYLRNSNVLQQELYGSYRDYFASTEDLVYKFTYDKSNRLLSATNIAGSFNEYKVENSYDKDGNILKMNDMLMQAICRIILRISITPAQTSSVA